MEDVQPAKVANGGFYHVLRVRGYRHVRVDEQAGSAGLLNQGYSFAGIIVGDINDGYAGPFPGEQQCGCSPYSRAGAGD